MCCRGFRHHFAGENCDWFKFFGAVGLALLTSMYTIYVILHRWSDLAGETTANILFTTVTQCTVLFLYACGKYEEIQKRLTARQTAEANRLVHADSVQQEENERQRALQTLHEDPTLERLRTLVEYIQQLLVSVRTDKLVPEPPNECWGGYIWAVPSGKVDNLEVALDVNAIAPWKRILQGIFREYFSCVSGLWTRHGSESARQAIHGEFIRPIEAIWLRNFWAIPNLRVALNQELVQKYQLPPV